MISRQFVNIGYILAAAAALTLAFGIANAADAGRHVKASAVVDGPVVTLGDLFDHDVDAAWAKVAVSDAPAPGETGRIRTTDVMIAARRAGLVWDQATAPHTLTITRTGQPVPLETLEELLAASLPANVGGEAWDLKLNNPRLSIYMPVGYSTADIEVRRFYFDDRSGSFNAALVIPDDNGRHHEETVTGRLVEMAYVPVLKQPVSGGDVIRKRDVHWLKVPARQVTRNVIARSDDIVGMAARRPLRPDTPVRPNDLERPVMVEKGATVTMIVTTEAMTLTANGRALEDGSKGDLIRLMNVSTHTTVEGVVLSPHEVAINNSNRVAALR